MIAHQGVEAVEILPHVSRAGRKVDPRRRSRAEHGERPLQHAQQFHQSLGLDNNTASGLYCFPVAAEDDIAASSTVISRLSPAMLLPLTRCSPDCFFRCRASVLKAIP
jgi:hypothetical protein